LGRVSVDGGDTDEAGSLLRMRSGALFPSCRPVARVEAEGFFTGLWLDFLWKLGSSLDKYSLVSFTFTSVKSIS